MPEHASLKVCPPDHCSSASDEAPQSPGSSAGLSVPTDHANEASALTIRQWQLARFIAGFIREHGYAPTIREMGEAMSIHSTNGVRSHLAALERKGFVRRTALTARSIQVLREV